MFQSSKKRIESLLSVVDDMLAGVTEPELPPHPHTRAVALRIERRAGAVPPRPMRCLSPVRPAALSSPAAPERELSR